MTDRNALLLNVDLIQCLIRRISLSNLLGLNANKLPLWILILLTIVCYMLYVVYPIVHKVEIFDLQITIQHEMPPKTHSQ